MAGSRGHLTVLPGERRKSSRPYLKFRTPVLLVWQQKESTGTFEGLDYGRLVFALSEDFDFPNPEENSTIELMIFSDGELVVDGLWFVRTLRRETGKIRLVLELPFLKLVGDLRHKIDPDIWLRKNRYRVFDLNEQKCVQDVNLHITEIKNCPLPISANLFVGQGSITPQITVPFNFESGARILEAIDFTLSQNITLCAGDKVCVEYHFLGVRYVFGTMVKNFDKDFGILSVALPPILVAITTRKFDRIPCHRIAELWCDGKPLFRGSITCISAAGCEVEVPAEIEMPNLPKEDAELILRVAEPEVRVVTRANSVTGRRVGLVFLIENEMERNSLRKLINSSLPQQMLIRESSNYQLFFDFYREVGYAPNTRDEFTQWSEETRLSWERQDAELPGNYIGAQKGSSLVISTGTLPISETVVFGHTWGMKKELESIAFAMDILAYSHAWIEFLDGITHLSWCVRKASRFMARLHFAFDFHAPPSQQELFHSLAILPVTKPTDCSDEFTFRELQDTALPPLPEKYSRLLGYVRKPHETLADLHVVKLELAFRKGYELPSALLICHSSPPRFTALDLYRCVWCLILDDSDGGADALCREIQSRPEFSGYEVDVFLAAGAKSPSLESFEPHATLPILWYFVPKDDFGPILASMFRTVYSVIRKYGEGAIPYLQRVI